MNVPRHGLVIGKFYPPHAGHALLVQTAASVCARVTVVVMAHAVESIPLALRVAWLREIHASTPHVTVTGIADNHPVDFEDDAVWHAHLALMREAARGVNAEPIDCVFTSEPYGEELGRRLGARHVAIDPDRRLVPVSGTAVRADIAAAWEYIAPCVRAYLVQRIVLTGAESTGKTTLARTLAERLRARGGAFSTTRWVAEYGRAFTLEKLARARALAQLRGERALPGMDDLVWQTADFVRIADEQNAREALAARHGGPILLCDTDAFATGVWHARYVGGYGSEVDARALDLRARHYLVTHPDDVPFEQDGIRDGLHVRGWMTGALIARLSAAGARWRWLRGEREQRIEAALAVADEIMAAGSGLAAPMG